MSLLRRASYLAAVLCAVAVGLPLGDGPRLSDEATAQPSCVDLVTQSGRRQTEPDCRLSEREHLASYQNLRPVRGVGERVEVVTGDHGRRDARQQAVGWKVGEADGAIWLDLRALGHLVPLAAVDVNNLDDTTYVVKPRTFAPPAVSSDSTLRGLSTWYDAPSPKDAAAGPALRSWLGKGWRGTTVAVCAGRCVTVRLSDWCACSPRHGIPTLLDLDDVAFGRLAPLSQGVVRVSVHRSAPSGPAPTLPPTDMEMHP